MGPFFSAYYLPRKESMSDNFKNDVRNAIDKSKFLHCLSVVLFLAIGYIGIWVLMVVIIFQLFWYAIFSKGNPSLTQFGNSMATYAYDVIRFLTNNSEDKPFPFKPWPTSDNNNTYKPN